MEVGGGGISKQVITFPIFLYKRLNLELPWERNQNLGVMLMEVGFGAFGKLVVVARGGQKPAQPNPPEQTGRPDHPPAHTYMDGYGLGYLYFSDFGRATDIMFLVGWLPDPPDQISIHIENKIKPLTQPPFSLI